MKVSIYSCHGNINIFASVLRDLFFYFDSLLFFIYFFYSGFSWIIYAGFNNYKEVCFYKVFVSVLSIFVNIYLLFFVIFKLLLCDIYGSSV